ncbi:MAG: ATP-binding protein [Bradyrhizobium sp.]|nr:ATP-binding protein [Bradyrhizobium sp.]
MIPKPLKDIRLTELESLIGIARESKTLEFKAELPRKADSELVPFIAGVSSLANTAGGDFVLGVYAREGVAAGVPGIAIPNLDAEKLRLEQALANGLEPRLPRVDIEALDCGGGQYVLVIRVPRSWVGPHRVKANNCFYGRNSGGRYPLDVGELRTAFVLSESVADRITSFRAERLSQIGGGVTPVPLPPGGRAILHVVPFPPFAGRHDIDVVQAISEGTFMPLPLGGMSGANQLSVNLNGIVNFAPGGTDIATSYVQFFRNGALEGVVALGQDEKNNRPYIAGPALCRKIVFALRQYVDVLNAYDTGFPVFALLSFMGMDGSTLRYNSGVGNGFSVAGPRSGATIILPEITLEGPVTDAPAVLKPTFNALWNAYGFLRCDLYDGQGTWTGDR